tara:strand:- start:472 stop:879 length:408 start_codon:yes stop_codon:yes gene_type:complete
LYVNSDGNLFFNLRGSDGPGTSLKAYSTSTVVTGSWEHIAAVYSVQDSEMRIYVNGTLEGSQITDGSTGLGTLSGSLQNGSLHFAKKPSDINDDNFAVITLDDVAWFDDALEASTAEDTLSTYLSLGIPFGDYYP